MKGIIKKSAQRERGGGIREQKLKDHPLPSPLNQRRRILHSKQRIPHMDIIKRAVRVFVPCCLVLKVARRKKHIVPDVGGLDGREIAAVDLRGSVNFCDCFGGWLAFFCIYIYIFFGCFLPQHFFFLVFTLNYYFCYPLP